MTRALTSIGLGFLSLMLSLPVTGAPLPSTNTPGAGPAQRSPLAKLQELLACQEADKAAAIAERAKVETHLHQIEAFDATLTDPSKHYLARQTAEQALRTDREALAKIDERLKLADLHIRMTQHALKHLARPAPDAVLSPMERAQHRLADLIDRINTIGDSEIDHQFEQDYGFVDDPAIQERLTRLLNQIQGDAPYRATPLTIKILGSSSDTIVALATRTHVYVGRKYLDTARPTSDDEWLFVLGHEIAHVEFHHVRWGSIKKKMEVLKQEWLTEPVEGWHPAYQDPQQYFDNAGFRTQMAAYIRQQESQADLLGAQLALGAGASPRGIKDAFTRLALEDLKWKVQRNSDHIEKNYDNAVDDHPEPMERLQALEQVIGQKFWERTGLQFKPSCPSSHP